MPPTTTGRVRVRGRRLEGLALPYGVAILAPETGAVERWAPGAFRAEAGRWRNRRDGARLPFLNRHGGEVIGAVDVLEDTPAGLRFRAELLDTAAARDYAAQVSAGANGISVEYDMSSRGRRLSSGGTEYTEGRLFAIAGSHAPAYDGARVALRNRGGAAMPPRTTTAPADYLDVLTGRLEALRQQRDGISAIAEAEGRELTDAELTQIDAMDQTEDRIEATIARAEEDRNRRQAEAGAAARATEAPVPVIERAARGGTTEAPTAGGPNPFARYTGPGAWLREQALARQGNTDARNRIERALANVTTTVAPGVIPAPIVGEIIGGFSRRRPLVDASNQVPIGDAGMSVIRPILTGGDVDEQVTQKTQVTSTAMAIDPITTPLKTYAGGVDVAWQLIERSSPAALDAIFRRLGNRYARRTEIVAAAAFVAGTSVAPIVTTAGLTAAKVIAALVQASAVIAADDDVDTFPDSIYMSLATWQTVAGLVDTTGRPLFPYGGGINSFGSQSSPGELGPILGLRPVVVPRFTGSVLTVGVAEYFETYELDGAPVEFRSIEADLLGTNVSVAGLFNAAVTDPAAFQDITLTA
jgi:HK97 family phage major capsid protein